MINVKKDATKGQRDARKS